MQFEIITPEEFRAFADRHPDKSFFQTAEIATLREKNGWTAYYFGVRGPKNPKNAPESTKSQNTPVKSARTGNSGRAENVLLAATMVVAKPTFLGKSTFYAPGGPLVDYEDEALLTFFVKHLKSYMRSHNGYVFHIDPYYELIERDKDGQIVANGFNHEKAAQNLQKLGFRPLKVSEQPKYLFALDLNGRTPDEIFPTFKQNTRNLIRRTERQGVRVRELSREELPLFKEITEATSERRGFADKPLSYYETMYDLFAPKGQVKFLIAEVENRPLSVAMFLLYGDEVLYLFSGSDKRYMHEFNAQYAIQWHMIKYAAEHGFKRYNFYGIQGLPDPAAKDYGVYKFKKGFDGRVIELLGSYELPLSPLYSLHRALSNLKTLITTQKS